MQQARCRSWLFTLRDAVQSVGQPEGDASPQRGVGGETDPAPPRGTFLPGAAPELADERLA